MKGLTLVELLCAMVLVLILALVFVPIGCVVTDRARVARSKSDMRTLAIAIDAYIVDWKVPPPDGDDLLDASNPVLESGQKSDVAPPLSITEARNAAVPSAFRRAYEYRGYGSWSRLTTPVAYMNSTLLEPYSAFIPYGFHNDSPRATNPAYIALVSMGPDRTIANDGATTGGLLTDMQGLRTVNLIYDPTNGTTSSGEVYRFTAIRDAKALARDYGSNGIPRVFPN